MVRPVLGRAAPLLALLAGLVAGSATAQPGGAPAADDPVLVFYPRRDCRGDSIQLEVFDRDTGTWVTHPTHPRVPVESCQVEDAGRLWNEIRWRCVEPPDTDPPSVWTVGIDVFDPHVMERCAAGKREAETGVELSISQPAQGATVRNPTMAVAVEGSVRMNGLPGSDYDVVIALDRSEATRRDGLDLLSDEIAAARAFVEELRPRLGSVRIGLISYPNLPPLPGDGGTGAHREIALGDDPAALEAALDTLRARGVSGFPTFLSAFAYALRELDPAQQQGARPLARKVLVLVSNARGRIPFGPGADEDANFATHLAALSQRVHEQGVSLQLVGLAGLAEATPNSVEAALHASGGGLLRVALPALETPFLSAVSLPELREVVIANRTAGLAPRTAQILPGGRFALTLPAAPDANRLWLRATLTDGASTEREWSFRFDDSWVRERLLDAEAERIQRVREQQKRLRLEPQWQAPAAKPGEAASPAPK
jgi:hypothetical protein